MPSSTAVLKPQSSVQQKAPKANCLHSQKISDRNSDRSKVHKGAASSSECINQRSWSPNNAINSLFIAFLLFQGYHLPWIHRARWRALRMERANFAVLAECKGVGDHFPGTTQQTGYFTHLSVFYHYSFFHNSLIS